MSDDVHRRWCYISVRGSPTEPRKPLSQSHIVKKKQNNGLRHGLHALDRGLREQGKRKLESGVYGGICKITERLHKRRLHSAPGS